MDKKKQYLFKDRLIKGITTDGFFKISVVKTTDVVKDAREKHQLSLLSTVLLGRTLTASLLLASELKGEERIRLHLQGKGPIGQILTEANAVGESRGFVENPQAELPLTEGTTLGDGIGLGVLTFSKMLYNEAKPISGTVELLKGNITEDVAYYLIQSEQVPSAITLDVGIDENGEITHCGGILIQALPGAPEKRIDDLQLNLQRLIPLSERFSSEEYIDDLMKIVASPLETRELERIPVHFFCRCTKDRFITALSMLQLEELEDMASAPQELVCHYCNKTYTISESEIQTLVDEKRVKQN
jgi:molecular chaperone Hsp33